jgi:hypothetical protein
MNGRHHIALPEAVLLACIVLIPLGILLGVLYGLNVISILLLDLVFFGSLAIFVPWAVLRLDPRDLAELCDQPDEG